jgi:hypothetical protein
MRTHLNVILRTLYFSGDVYTLITVDPDVPYPNFGTEERPLLHGMVTNIINGNLSTGKKWY